MTDETTADIVFVALHPRFVGTRSYPSDFRALRHPAQYAVLVINRGCEVSCYGETMPVAYMEAARYLRGEGQ